MPAARFLVAVLLALLLAVPVVAQQATVGSPMNVVGDSFYENMNLNWGLNGPGWFFRFGGGGATPPFGGYDPNAGATFGWGFRHNNINGHFMGSMGQGYRQSLVSQAPSMTLSNGVPGYFGDSSISPFVVGFVPVVGAYPMTGGFAPVSTWGPAVPPAAYSGQAANPAVAEALERVRAKQAALEQPEGAIGPKVEAAQQRLADRLGAKVNAAADRVAQAQDDLNLVAPAPRAEAPGNLRDASPGPALGDESSATRPAPSVAEARRLRDKEKVEADQQVAEYLERGRHAEATGKPAVARQYYQMAYRRASDAQKVEIRERILALPPPTSKAK